MLVLLSLLEKALRIDIRKNDFTIDIVKDKSGISKLKC